MARKKSTNEQAENEVMDTISAANPTENNKKQKVSFQDTYERGFGRIIVKSNPITSREEATSAIRMYYDIQDFRIGAGNRQFQLDSKDESDKEIESTVKENEATNNISFAYAKAGLKDIEEVIASWLEDYVKRDPIGKWLLTVKGIGPVLAAGFLSYIDISKCQTAGSIWRYGGIEGHRAPRKKGVKLDYNPHFKVLCWKAGEQFAKVSGYKKDSDGNILLDENGNPIDRIPDAIYGHLYREKLKEYIERNERGGFTELAALTLKEKNFEKETEAKKTYESGKLPMAHMISMAKRYAEKIFLSHLFTVWYEYANGRPAPRPFAEVHLGHVHIIEPPHKEILGLKPGRDSF